MSNVDSPLLKAYLGLNPKVKPVWFMRQAGRYLPEYQKLRKQYSMLLAIQTPKISAEITLQPLKRFDLDAAIIFADILNPLIGMGINLDFIDKEGPKIYNPLKSQKDVESLIVPSAEKSVAYTLEAIEVVKKNLPKGKEQIVLGFSGAPFTLSTYLIEGKTSHSLLHVKNFISQFPNAWNQLQEKLCVYIVDYLTAQVNAGASAVQLFDSWAGYLSSYSFKTIVLPILKKLVKEYKSKCKAPIIYFSTGTSGYLDIINEIPVDGFSIDWRMSIKQASQCFGVQFPIQGNLDPELMAGNLDVLLKEVELILEDSSHIPNHIFNLGHGILPSTPIENVHAVIETVKKFK